MTEVRPTPFLVRSWQGGITGWIVVFTALLAELIAGVVVNTSSIAVALPVYVIPPAIAVGLGIVQWWQARSAKVEPPSWWHLGAIAIALLTWIVWPVTPSALQTVPTASDACTLLYTATPDCVARATSALSNSHITWWVTGVLILALAPLARRSRIAPWAAVPLAFAGCQLAGHFLELLLLRYHYPGA